MSKIETNTIDTVSGTTNLTIGSTNSSTVTFENGSCTGHMFPAFLVFMDADQTVTSGTWTKLLLDTTTYDTDSGFASNKYTVPSNKGGKYLISYAAGTGSLTSSSHGALRVYKNGSSVNSSFIRSYPNSSTGAHMAKTIPLELAAGDYLELYGQHTKGSDVIFDSRYTFLSAFRIGA